MEDPYGTPLTYMAAHTLALHLADLPLAGFDAATLAYVAALAREPRGAAGWRVVLRLTQFKPHEIPRSGNRCPSLGAHAPT